MSIYRSSDPYRIKTSLGTGYSFHFSGSSNSTSIPKSQVDQLSLGYELFDVRAAIDGMNAGDSKVVATYANGCYVKYHLNLIIDQTFVSGQLVYYNAQDQVIMRTGGSTSRASAYEYRGLTLGYQDDVLYRFSVLYNDSSNTFTFSNSGDAATYQDYLNGAIPPLYAWTAWDQIAGNSGQYRCNLSKIKDSAIGDISNYVTTTDPTDFNRISEQSNIWNTFLNMAKNTPKTIAWSGQGWMTLTISDLQGYSEYTTFTFKFYHRQISSVTPLYQFTVSVDTGSSGSGRMRACYLAFVYDREEQVAHFTPVFKSENVYSWGHVTDDDITDMGNLFLWLTLSGSPSADSPYSTGTTDDGGNPGGLKPQDHISTPAVPTLDGIASGMFTVYCPTSSQLEAISEYLWDNDIIENMHKYFNNFSDNIIALYVLPCKPANNPVKTFKVGNLASTDPDLASVEYLSTRFIKIDMGECVISPFWDSYLDYAPYSKFEIYLPGIGIQALDADDIICPSLEDGSLPKAEGSIISLEYMIDLMTGVLVAFVSINGEMRYQFPGKMGFSIPLTGENYARLMTGFVSATAGLLGTLATGGAAAPFAAAASTAGIVNAMKPDVYRGGNLSGDASMLSSKSPYLIYRRPNKPLLEGQENFTGFPSYKIGLLSEFSGYTEVLDAHVEGISCTDEERDQILALLKGGVII